MHVMGLMAMLVLCGADDDGGAGQPRAAGPAVGLWDAWLDSPGGRLRFGLELSRDGDDWQAALVNGSERIGVPRVTVDGTSVVFDIAHYDATVRAEVSHGGTHLDGAWRKRTRGDKPARLGFHARPHEASRMIGLGEAKKWAAIIDGRWAVDFSSSDEPAVAVFQAHPQARITGTVMTTTGDYRYLAGDVDSTGQLSLSCFDGAHAFLLRATVRGDRTLAGDFWSRDSWHETWTAERHEDAKLPDAFQQTRPVPGVKLSQMAFRDLQGRMRSLDEFGGPLILEVFGSWCPNCHDAAGVLSDLHADYGDRGLSVVGLAFELTGDFERDARQVRRYARRHDISYPLLIAGVADKEQASAALPLIDALRSYPTTVFLDADTNIVAIHTGFTGPATGDAHAELRAEFRRIAKELIDGSRR